MQSVTVTYEQHAACIADRAEDMACEVVARAEGPKAPKRFRNRLRARKRDALDLMTQCVLRVMEDDIAEGDVVPAGVLRALHLALPSESADDDVLVHLRPLTANAWQWEMGFAPVSALREHAN